MNRFTWKAKNECVNCTVAFIFSNRQFWASVSSSVSCRLCNCDDIFEQFDGIISLKTQMAEYVTETKGNPGKKKRKIFYANQYFNIYIFSVFACDNTRHRYCSIQSNKFKWGIIGAQAWFAYFFSNIAFLLECAANEQFYIALNRWPRLSKICWFINWFHIKLNMNILKCTDRPSRNLTFIVYINIINLSH